MHADATHVFYCYSSFYTNNLLPAAINFTKSYRKWYGKADVVLCDVPCSGLGIMGRKNDIKYNIDKAGVISLSELSKQILSNACRYVKPGGTLLFSTCTITGLENEDTVKWIRENTDLVPETLADHLPENLKDRGNRGYMTLLQGKDSCDGFFMARFVRKR